MVEYAVLAAALGVFITALAARKRGKLSQSLRRRTVTLDVTNEAVARTLGDGRVESARWAHLGSIEVVCTPVKTADGASAFLLLGETATAGCLVPLGVGLESEVLVELSKLPGFRLERLTTAQSHKAPHREVVWTRRDDA